MNLSGSDPKVSDDVDPVRVASGWSDAERERAYSPSSCIGGNYQPHIERYAKDSATAVQKAEAVGGTWRWASCGTGPRPQWAMCLPGATRGLLGHPSQGVPLLLFVHGGYWQELSARESLFAAPMCIERGCAFAALDYTLAPASSVQGIVQECVQALAWLGANAKALGVDASRIVVAGSSAGAHLASMMALPGAAGLVQPASAVLVSGVYALEPLVGTSINQALGLDAASARASSPGCLPLRGHAPALVAWGEVETQAFKHQSRYFARQLNRAGVVCDTMEVAQRNHFDVIMDLADPATDLGRATLARLLAA